GTPEGAVIITGCAHPGIVNIVKRAREITDGRILLAIGGFHLFAHPDREVRAIIRELKALGLERAGPCHCTGARAIELFREEFGRDFVPVGVGTVLEIGKAGKESHE
ncbi:MAG: MBL fold metallo-hydrolase, partial [Deltaproteobacteria bacterium]|nr:MBL fold metallo-hydrolase [Deltaproteobacteria bacterium]